MPREGHRDRRLTRLQDWPQYFAGMLTEMAFILGLTLVAFLIAALAMVIYR